MRAPQDHPEVELLDEVGRIAALARAAVRDRLPGTLTYPQFEVLNLLVRRGDGATPAELAGTLMCARSAFTHTLRGLQQGGLIRVEADPADGRRKRLRLTAEGRNAYGGALAAVRPRMEALRARFAAGEFRAALPFLRDLRGWLSGP